MSIEGENQERINQRNAMRVAAVEDIYSNLGTQVDSKVTHGVEILTSTLMVAWELKKNISFSLGINDEKIIPVFQEAILRFTRNAILQADMLALKDIVSGTIDKSIRLPLEFPELKQELWEIVCSLVGGNTAEQHFLASFYEGSRLGVVRTLEQVEGGESLIPMRKNLIQQIVPPSPDGRYEHTLNTRLDEVQAYYSYPRNQIYPDTYILVHPIK